MYSPYNTNDRGPEFLDSKGLEQQFGIRRSLAYDLIARGAIHSVSLRKRGSQRGKRLFNVDSVRSYLKSCAQPQPTKGGVVV